ncbi:MAG: hypothetical protein AB7Q37_03280 [Pyrinomonadaceae bacterium]
MPEPNSAVTSRAAGKENRRLGRLKKASRLKYQRLIQGINDWAKKYVFRSHRLNGIRAKRQLIRNNNPDESQATISDWVWSGLVLVGLTGVVVIDYLVVGGTLDYLLGMQRELQGLEEYYVYLKVLATLALLAIEVAIAIGLIWLREHSDSLAAVATHWLVGIGLASALTAFAFGLMYTKVKNEGVNVPLAAVTDDLTNAAAGIAEAPIPTHKWVMLLGVCSICFFVHLFALMKAESVAESFALAGYGGHQAVNATREAISRFQTNRAAGKAEAFYRDAYDHFETHNVEFADDPLPSVPSQQAPDQQIPVMRLSPVAQRIIENLQNGAVENLGGVRNNVTDERTNNSNAEVNEEEPGPQQPPDNPPDQEFGNANPTGNDPPGSPDNGQDFAGRQDDDRDHQNRDSAAAEANYLRTILEAEVRNSDGEL